VPEHSDTFVCSLELTYWYLGGYSIYFGRGAGFRVGIGGGHLVPWGRDRGAKGHDPKTTIWPPIFFHGAPMFSTADFKTGWSFLHGHFVSFPSTVQ